jgi:hypothetical protein
MLARRAAQQFLLEALSTYHGAGVSGATEADNCHQSFFLFIVSI